MFFDREEFIALIFSMVIESLFVACWGKILRLHWRFLIAVACAATLITHPVIWQLFINLSLYLNFYVRSLLLETLVFIFEGLIYKWVTGYSWRLSMSLSFGANLASYSGGILFYSLQR